MILEVANKYVAIHAFALKALVIALPTGREYHVTKGSVFLSSPEVAHRAAIAGQCRAVDWNNDSGAPVWGDRGLFDQHRNQFFDLAYDNAQLAVRIALYKEPPPPIIIDATRPPAEPPPPKTGFEYNPY